MHGPELPTLIEALRISLKSLGSAVDGVTPQMRLAELELKLKAEKVPAAALLAEAALAAAKPDAVGSTATRDSLQYIVSEGRSQASLRYGQGNALEVIPAIVGEAVAIANAAIKVVHDVSQAYDVLLFDILGLRNLSSFVGEVFKDQLARLMPDSVIPNPNQDGHPDLLALTREAKPYLDRLEREGLTSAKEYFSPFPYGGLEVKATCGDTPPARVMAKPKIGESRLSIMTGLNWKAHHRETNHLISLVWDFVDGIPTILAAFYRNDLSPDDWGRMVTPGEGSRTTSVSIMAGVGVRKMAAGWVVLPGNAAMRERISAAMKTRLVASPPPVL